MLGFVDGQALYDEAMAYDEFIDEIDPLPIADAPEKGSAWLLSLGGQWFQCETWRSFGPFSIKNAAAPIRGGMSGSPILADVARLRSGPFLLSACRFYARSI